MDVDVVIRTAGDPARYGSLRRAIASVANQRGVRAGTIAVVNGKSLPAWLGDAIQLHRVRGKISPGTALGIGRGLVSSPYFAFLDDDDELLPHALATSLDLLSVDPATDVVVTSGYYKSGEQVRLHIPNIAREQSDPLSGIVERSWLNPGGAVFRTATISQRYFDDLPGLCEWTFLAFNLALDGRRIRFVDCPTYLAHDTPGSLSKTSAYVEAVAATIERMRQHSLPPALRAKLERKYRVALHESAERSRQEGNLRKAWRYHLLSLASRECLTYLAYTRKLVWKM